ncbi:MAG: hypothetical protein HRT36_03775 [Alphaproteobacteria bacterium]|nr:hypothetical protein [Alphaproteobacteria bacterium]
MQPLAADAIKRRETFEEFVKSTAKAEENKTKRVLQFERAQQTDGWFDDFERLLRDELDLGELENLVQAVIQLANARLEAALADKTLPIDSLVFPKAELNQA